MQKKRSVCQSTIMKVFGNIFFTLRAAQLLSFKVTIFTYNNQVVEFLVCVCSQIVQSCQNIHYVQTCLDGKHALSTEDLCEDKINTI